jgi:hypothetical protein
MARKVVLTETQLKKLIDKVIAEQATGEFNVGQSFTKGRQSTVSSGKQAQQAVVAAAGEVAKAGKQVLIKIGNITIKAITYGAAVVWLIGKGVYKLTAAIANSILKLITATGKAVVSAATALDMAAVNTLRTVGIAIEKGAKWVGQQLTSLKDSTIAVVKWVIGAMKQFGAKVWAKVLAGAAAIAGVGQQLGQWLGSQWSTIQKEVGVAWDQAKSWASGALKSAGQAISNTASKIKSGVANAANAVAGAAGKAAGWLQGFLSELFNRFVSFKGEDMMSILSEARQYNGKAIVL